MAGDKILVSDAFISLVILAGAKCNWDQKSIPASMITLGRIHVAQSDTSTLLSASTVLSQLLSGQKNHPKVFTMLYTHTWNRTQNLPGVRKVDQPLQHPSGQKHKLDERKLEER